MKWFLANLGMIAQLSWAHLVQAVLPLAVALVIAVPLAQWLRGSRVRRSVAQGVTSFLFTIPSIALFIFLPLVLGTSIISPVNVIVALSIYACSLLIKSAIDAFDSVDPDVKQAALALGYTPWRRFWTVELPLSLPVLFSGLRVISLTNISLVSIAIVIGVRNLGFLFSDGLRRDFPTEIVTGIILTLVLALVMDLVLVGVQRALTPWAARRGA